MSRSKPRTSADYSVTEVTPAQRGHFKPLMKDGAWASPWSDPPPSVENAHDKQAAPTHLHEGRLSNNASGAGSAPVVDR